MQEFFRDNGKFWVYGGFPVSKTMIIWMKVALKISSNKKIKIINDMIFYNIVCADDSKCYVIFQQK